MDLISAGARLQPLQRAVADPQVCTSRCRRRSSCTRARPNRHGARLDGLRGRRRLGRRSCADRCSHQACACTRAQRSSAAVLLHGVDVGAGAIVRNAIVDKNVQIAPGAQIGSTPPRDRRALSHLQGRNRRDRQGRDRGCLSRSVALLTREYPPEVYGGAGVHVEYLARELARLVEVTVHAWGGERPRPGPDGPPVRHLPSLGRAAPGPSRFAAALEALSIDLAMVAGRRRRRTRSQPHLVREPRRPPRRARHGIPHVATVHSLEPMRPWKAEQLGGGYAVSSFAERTGLEGADAVIAVSAGMRSDLLAVLSGDRSPAASRVIHNGIDTDEYRPDRATDALERYGIDPDARASSSSAGSPARRASATCWLRPSASTRSPVRALRGLARHAGDRRRDRGADRAPAREPRAASSGSTERLPRAELIQLLSHAAVFVCPSVYEPLGIVNLEAMACEAAVVATHTGGIPEVVVDGVTGSARPDRAARRRLARAARPGRVRARRSPSASTLCSATRQRATRMLGRPDGKGGRALQLAAIAARTVELYRRLV